MTRWLPAMLVVACGAPATPSQPPQTPPPPQSTEPTACCASYDDLRALDGRRVVLVGTYEPTAVRKGKPRAEDDAKARTVAIHTSGDLSVMLEVYYAPLGTRSDDEIARFAHKRVRVVGTMHARTPERIVDGEGPLQTMIGPCVTDIEAISEAP